MAKGGYKGGRKRTTGSLQQRLLTDRITTFYNEMEIRPKDDMQLADEIHAMLIARFKSSYHQSRDQLLPQIDQSKFPIYLETSRINMFMSSFQFYRALRKIKEI